MAVSPDAGVPAEEELAQPGLADQLSATLANTRRAAAELLGLFGLEARPAGLSAAKILALAVAAAFTVIAAWLFVQGALIVWLHQLGLNLGLAFLLFGILNLAVTALLGWMALRASRNMTFAATRRALKKEAEEADEHLETEHRPPGAGVSPGAAAGAGGP
jgi:hypothetical protein